VISGIRAGKASVVLENIEPANTEVRAAVQDIVAPAAPLPLPPKPIELSPELIARSRALETEVAELHKSKLELEATFGTLSEQEQHARVRVEAIDAQLSAARTAAQDRRQQFEQLVSALEVSKRELGQLQQTLSDVEQKKSPVTTLRHKVTSISREVHSKEVHFRLLNNRAAHVPIDELVARMKPQIERQKDLLLKYRQQEGEVGPVEGFAMRYVVEREPLGTVDELGGGRGMMRISVSKWEVVPQPELQTESVEEALQRHSAYARTLRMCDVNSVVTFWVYPDSFEIYRKLRDLAYQEGFTVAARPIPLDVPIAGSPRGSRSSGQ